MSFFPAKDPAAGDAPACDAIAHVIAPRTVDIGGLEVRRALPSAQTRMVGPFIFFDHFGPAEFRSGTGLDVRPHPHIGLATLTYLFDGEIFHRDSLGSAVPIRPGEVNWMIAGRGIVHSERTSAERRAAGDHLHGLQCWIALPAAQEERIPSFSHHGAEQFPKIAGDGMTVRVAMGALYGARSPVEVLTDTVFAEVRLAAGASLPIDADHEERAIYVVSGEIDIAGDRFGAARLIVFRPGDRLTVAAVGDAQFIVLGGAVMDGPRHIWWNFVSSRRERIDEAKAQWKAGRFSAVPGESEFIPLPEQ